jgi:uncharacterized membrane protein YebE (DUF533 family)
MTDTVDRGEATMFDANKILGVLMESGMAGSRPSRMQRAAGSGSPILNDALEMLSASSRGVGGGRPAAGAGGLPRSSATGGSGGGLGGLGELLGGAGGSGGLGGLGALLGGSSGRGALGGGAMGLLGALASIAMQQFGSSQAAARSAAQPGMAEEPAPFADDQASDEQGHATLMIRAMIMAAKADGEIDPQERQRILGRLEEAGADPEAETFVREEMTRPVDLHAIVSAVDSPHTAIEAYAASLFAIDIDTPAEAAYMRQLAHGLGLNPTLVRELHASLEAPKPH